MVTLAGHAKYNGLAGYISIFNTQLGSWYLGPFDVTGSSTGVGTYYRWATTGQNTYPGMAAPGTPLNAPPLNLVALRIGLRRAMVPYAGQIT